MKAWRRFAQQNYASVIQYKRFLTGTSTDQTCISIPLQS
jgi:hypothetical protein